MNMSEEIDFYEFSGCRFVEELTDGWPDFFTQMLNEVDNMKKEKKGGFLYGEYIVNKRM